MKQHLEERAVGIDDNVTVAVVDAETGDIKRRASTHNVTCVGLHRQVAILLNHHNEYDTVVDPPTEIAFGDDWGGGTSPDSGVFNTSDTELNNRVGAVELTDPSSTDTTYRVSEQVSSLELNGESIRELGIVTESGKLWNHAPMPTEIEEKTSSEALSISISLPIGDNS